MNDICILITAAGSMVANSIISNFKNINEREIKIIGCDIKKKVASQKIINKYYQIPRIDDKNYINNILDICNKEKVDIVIPLIDKEIIKISNNKDKFKNFKLLIINSINNDIIFNKGKLYQYLKYNNINIPQFKIVHNYNDFIESCKLLNYPNHKICFKPTISSGSRGFHIIDNNISESNLLFDKPNSLYINYQTINNIIKNNNIPELVFMEYLTNEQYIVHILADNGKIISSVIILVLEENTSNLIDGITIYDHNIQEYCNKIVNLLKLDGIFGIELKKDQNGLLKILEINPRIQGSISVCTNLGINLAYYGVKKLLKENFNIPSYKKNVRMIRNYQDTFIDIN